MNAFCSVFELDRLRAQMPAGNRVRATRIADVVANRVRERILAGEFGDGQRLPSVDLLMRELGVSEAAVREALRILESEGLITVARGNRGGTFARPPDSYTAAYAVGLVLKSGGVNVGEVLETQSYIEPICAALCARDNGRRQSIVPLLHEFNATARTLLEAGDADFTRSMLGFHQALVEGCGNSTLSLFVGILESMYVATMALTEDDIARGQGTASDRDSKIESIRFHEQIATAVESGDETGASELMADHVASLLRSYTADRLEEPVDPTVIRLAW